MSEALGVADAVSSHCEDVDVLIAGAGISGIGSAYHLRTQCPGKSFVILEAQDGFGGTWRTHTYPGVRSDSDLYTFGYRFKPWVGPPIATAQAIRDYLDAHNEQPKPFRWTKSADEIIDSVNSVLKRINRTEH